MVLQGGSAERGQRREEFYGHIPWPYMEPKELVYAGNDTKKQERKQDLFISKSDKGGWRSSRGHFGAICVDGVLLKSETSGHPVAGQGPGIA
jgi:hypothetical protein